MVVLSLFDGMSCGQIALNKLGITDYTYYAAEIKSSAIKVTKHNYPNTIHIGDFCRYLTRRELEQAQTVPLGYTDCVSYHQAQDLLGDGWTVDVIVHLLKDLKFIIELYALRDLITDK